MCACVCETVCLGSGPITQADKKVPEYLAVETREGFDLLLTYIFLLRAQKLISLKHLQSRARASGPSYMRANRSISFPDIHDGSGIQRSWSTLPRMWGEMHGIQVPSVEVIKLKLIMYSLFFLLFLPG